LDCFARNSLAAEFIGGGGGMAWWHSRKQDENFGIAAGQRFRSVGAGAIIWEVATISRYSWDAAPHVRLQRVGVPGDAKTISLQVLRDGRFYQPAG
jgi:hypothetical protein